MVIPTSIPLLGIMEWNTHVMARREWNGNSKELPFRSYLHSIPTFIPFHSHSNPPYQEGPKRYSSNSFETLITSN